MIEQCLDGDTGSSKAWDTAKDVRDHENGSGQSGRIHKLNLRSMGRRSSGVETGPWRAPTLAPTGSGQVRGRRVGCLILDFEFLILDFKLFVVESLGSGGISEAA